MKHTNNQTFASLWNLVVILLFGCLASTSCSDDVKDSDKYTDPLPLPAEIEANKDLTVKPGDSFFDYCNGNWLRNTEPPATGTIGGLYDAEPAMEERVKILKKENPSVARFFQLSDKMYTNADKAMEYIEEQKARYAKPNGATKEDAFRKIGEQVMEGVSSIIGLDIVAKNGVLCANVSFYGVPEAGEYDEEELVPLHSTRADNSSVLDLIVEGMGIDPATIYMMPGAEESFEALREFSVDELYDLMWMSWDDQMVFESEEYVEAFNARYPPEYAMSKEYWKMQARAAFGYELSYHFANKYLTEEHKQKYIAITKEIQAALRKRLEQVDWMSATTKNNALEKLDEYGIFVDYPDTWHTEAIPDIATCKSMAEVVHKLSKGKMSLYKAILGTKDVFSYFLTLALSNDVNDPRYGDLTLVNAMYVSTYNSILIYPAMLIEPFMPENVSDAYAYARFSVMGHELTHGFDADGAKYDKLGNLHNWWTVADQMTFEERYGNLINWYNHMELDPDCHPGEYCDGYRTITANIADLGGFLAALDAYKAHIGAPKRLTAEYKDQIKKFYECYANLWCNQYSEERYANIRDENEHSHSRLRVNGVVMNTDLWYDLYDVDSNQVLYLPKDRRTYIW